MKAQTKTHQSITTGGTVLSRYQDTIVGSRSIPKLLYFEFCSFLSNISGAFGLFLRKIFLPKLLGSCGKGVVIGKNVIIRHPKRIHLGKNVIIGDGCILDARTETSNEVIKILNNTMLANNILISCKGGTVEIEKNVGLGSQVIIQSTSGNPVKIGSDVIIGPQCYITGGGNYNFDRLDIPIREQGMKVMGGTTIGNDVWLGAGVKVLGGITIGSQGIIASGAVVTKTLPPKAISKGVPAQIVKYRT